jgi:16S rRNA (cytidine1402-2'-O)-methyltransferase
VVAAALAAGCAVEPVPGPCALIAALTASGLPSEEFHFAGFLPHKSGQRATRLRELGALPGTLVLYESPFRVERLIAELVTAFPGRPVVLAREVTKKFEEWLRGTPAELAAIWQKRPRKGEFVVMIGPADGPAVPSGPDSEQEVHLEDPSAGEAADDENPAISIR